MTAEQKKTVETIQDILINKIGDTPEEDGPVCRIVSCCCHAVIMNGWCFCCDRPTTPIVISCILVTDEKETLTQQDNTMTAAESKEINELRTGELVKVNGDWYVFGIVEVDGEIDEETGAVEEICCPALYTTADWFSECEAVTTIKTGQELNQHVSAAFERYITPEQIVSTGKFLKGYKPTN